MWAPAGNHYQQPLHRPYWPQTQFLVHRIWVMSHDGHGYISFNLNLNLMQKKKTKDWCRVVFVIMKGFDFNFDSIGGRKGKRFDVRRWPVWAVSSEEAQNTYYQYLAVLQMHAFVFLFLHILLLFFCTFFLLLLLFQFSFIRSSHIAILFIYFCYWIRDFEINFCRY